MELSQLLFMVSAPVDFDMRSRSGGHMVHGMLHARPRQIRACGELYIPYEITIYSLSIVIPQVSLAMPSTGISGLALRECDWKCLR